MHGSCPHGRVGSTDSTPVPNALRTRPKAVSAYATGGEPPSRDKAPALRKQNFQRHSDTEYNLQLIRNIRELDAHDVIVGIDVMGHERNSTETVKPVLQAKPPFGPSAVADVLSRTALVNLHRPENNLS